MKNKICRDMVIADIFASYPSYARLLSEEMDQSGLHCALCGGAKHETLEQGMYSHGMTDIQIDALIARLNEIVNETLVVDPVVLTPLAAEQFRAVCARQKKPVCAIRLGIEKSGCCCAHYFMDCSVSPLDTDAVFESEGIQIHVQKELLHQLGGTVIDYVDDSFQVRKKNQCSGGCCH
jgi:iron-sulfur cluster assembly protein